jgi:hypothetical protein
LWRQWRGDIIEGIKRGEPEPPGLVPCTFPVV